MQTLRAVGNLPTPGHPLSDEIVHTRLCQLEVEQDLLQYEAEGWCAWPLLRFDVARRLAGVSMAQRKPLGRIKRGLISLPDMFRLILPRRAPYIVKTYSSGLLDREGVFYRDIWFDDLLQELGDCFKIETINSPNFLIRRRAALIKSDLSSTLFENISAVLGLSKTPSEISAIAHSLSLCLRREFGSDLFPPDWIETSLARFARLKALYGWLLARVHPQCLLIADPGEHALVAAAKEHGIAVVELQHGINDRFHSGYSWTRYAAKYKPRMPIPDRLFLYGDYWRQELESGGFWGEMLRVVGSPRMDRYRRMKPAARKRQDEWCLVLTTQGADVERVIAFVAAFLAEVHERVALRLCIKLHPVYETSNQLYMAAFRGDPRVQVLLGNEGPSTFELLTGADFHLSISSASHYDSLGLGVPTVILPFANYEIVLHLHKAGHAFLARSPRELLDIVFAGQYAGVPAEVGEYYFRSGALENMRRELGLGRGAASSPSRFPLMLGE